jgi:metal-responsive CopG/Arc/MetJ family transcriptional regulator
MKTIQMTLDDELVAAVDKIVKLLKTTRSAFTRDALRRALKEMNVKKLEEKHRIGYSKKPVACDEFSDWETEQKWGD